MTQTKDSAAKVASRPTTVPNARPTTVPSRPTTVASRPTTVASQLTKVPSAPATTAASRATTAASQVPNSRATTAASQATEVTNIVATQVDDVDDSIIDRLNLSPRLQYGSINFINRSLYTLNLEVYETKTRRRLLEQKDVPSQGYLPVKIRSQVPFCYVVRNVLKKVLENHIMQVKGPTRIEVSASVPK